MSYSMLAGSSDFGTRYSERRRHRRTWLSMAWEHYLLLLVYLCTLCWARTAWSCLVPWSDRTGKGWLQTQRQGLILSKTILHHPSSVHTAIGCLSRSLSSYRSSSPGSPAPRHCSDLQSEPRKVVQELHPPP